MSVNDRPMPAGKILARSKRHWWERSRLLARDTQINAREGLPPCIESYVPWWGWPFEAARRLIFRRPRLIAVSCPDPLPEATRIAVQAQQHAARLQESTREFDHLHRTAREVQKTAESIQRAADEASLREAFRTANDLCRTMHAIAEREGIATDWSSFRRKLRTELGRQHELMKSLGLYP